MTGVGEAALSAFFQVIVGKILSLELPKFAREKEVIAEVKKWKKMLTQISAVLDDAEEKQMANSQLVQVWLRELKDLVYDVDDILDEFDTECSGRKLMAETQAITGKGRKLPSIYTRFNPFGKAFMFNQTTMKKIKEITTRLQDIVDQKNSLNLREIVGGTSNRACQRPPSTCLQAEPEVYGRNEDKVKISDLLRHEASNAKVGVIPSVGMGGMGKTTLARLVYNEKASVDFDIKGWVCVSDEFDIMRITKGILESITKRPCDLKELNQVQLSLSEALAGKKFLLVLDDVWSNNYTDWDALRSPFMVGATGSKIIVTTRSTNIGLMMGTVECQILKPISDDDCWSIFTGHAFEGKNMDPNLEVIGRKIVKRCGGLPLAARTLGGLLRSKRRNNEWVDILNSKIWSLQDGDSDIIPVLRLSYYHLPSHLKRCFAYCAIIPKDYEFEKKELVLLWMAEGLIPQEDDKKPMEDLGGEYFHDLVSRSVFQVSSRDESRFVMHDLVNDLAQWVAGETCFRLEDVSTVGGSGNKERVRHSSYTVGRFDGINKFEPFQEMKYLRTFLPLNGARFWFSENNVASQLLSKQLLPKLGLLRVLSFNGYNINKLPDSIGDLKHLRYLDLSFTEIRSLPKSTTSLYNLQTLLLKFCWKLKELPSKMRNLVNLRHLDITGVNLTSGMPLGLKELKSLRFLSNFVAGKDNGCSVTELMNLKFLGRHLGISGLENVTNPRDARDANLIDKEDLDFLFLQWERCSDRDARRLLDRDVLGGLQPHGNLKRLSIRAYYDTTFPSWVGDPSLICNLELLQLSGCGDCTSLPPLGLLPPLKELYINGMSSLKRIDREFYGETNSYSFPALERLHFANMNGWMDWNPCGVEFPRLHELSIINCSKLQGKLPGHLPSLEKLVITECRQLVVSLSSVSMVSYLEITSTKEVVFCSPNSSDISTLAYAVDGFLQGLKKVKSLVVLGDDSGYTRFRSSTSLWVLGNCPLLISMVVDEKEEQLQQGLAGSQLEYFELTNFESLEKLPQWLHSLASLRKLRIAHCPKLVSFSEAGFPSGCLEKLEIECCRSLVSFGSGYFPPTLKNLSVLNCENLKILMNEEEGSSCSFSSSPSSSSSTMHNDNISNLESLSIDKCPSLTSLSPGGVLPASLGTLYVARCSKLESLAERFHNTFLETISIFNCQNLKSLPDGLHSLINLCEIEIDSCPSLVSFPSGGLPTTSLKKFSVHFCEELGALPDNMHNLAHLRELKIRDCPFIISFPEEGFPTNLTFLTISNVNFYERLFEWGLHRLTFLRELCIDGGCPDMVCFPSEDIGMTLPNSLSTLRINDFPNLKYLSTRGFQNLTSLQRLQIYNCPKLTSFPKGGFPSSLLNLEIRSCPLLKQRYKKGKGQEWLNIAQISYVEID